jgi:hypothetical protein
MLKSAEELSRLKHVDELLHAGMLLGVHCTG